MKILLLSFLLCLPFTTFADPDLGEPEPVTPPPAGDTNPAPAPTPAPTGNPEVDMPPVACTAVENRAYVYSCRVMASWHVTHWDSARMIERNPFCQRIQAGLYYCDLNFADGTYN